MNFNDLLSLINILEKKNFIVYLIINYSDNLSLKVIELYYKNEAILIWLLIQTSKNIQKLPFLKFLYLFLKKVLELVVCYN